MSSIKIFNLKCPFQRRYCFKSSKIKLKKQSTNIRLFIKHKKKTFLTLMCSFQMEIGRHTNYNPKVRGKAGPD